MSRVQLIDEKWMRVAIGLARRGLGQVAPNPAVGCVLVKDNIVVGRGWTQPGGRPHAETEALAQAGAAAKNATAYVTLEPCSHTGETSPCADALVSAEVSRVVVGATDPDPRVFGEGIKKLRTAGIEVCEAVLEQESMTLNSGFFNRVSKKRPRFTLKIASTIDGKIALQNGDSKWITGDKARKFGHLMRAKHDAILVGANTVLADNPELTCRIPGLEHRSPIRIVLDSDLRIPATAAILDVSDQAPPTFIVTKLGSDKSRIADRNIDFIDVATPYDLHVVAGALAERGLTSVLVEGGAQIAASFVSAGLVDNLYVFSSGKIIGNSGLNAIGDLDLAALPDAPHFIPTGIRRLGPDMLATYRKAE